MYNENTRRMDLLGGQTMGYSLRFNPGDLVTCASRLRQYASGPLGPIAYGSPGLVLGWTQLSGQKNPACQETMYEVLFDGRKYIMIESEIK